MPRAVFIWATGALLVAAIIGMLELQSAAMLSEACVHDVEQRGLLILCMGPPDEYAYVVIAIVMALAGSAFIRLLLPRRARLAAGRAS